MMSKDVSAPFFLRLTWGPQRLNKGQREEIYDGMAGK